MATRCARPACRAWAMRGATHCWSHRGDATPWFEAFDDAPNGRRERSAAFTSRVTHGADGDLVERAVREVLGAMAAGAGTPLDGEIRALRLILSRVIALDALEGEPREVAQTVTRLVDAIVRAVRAQHGLAADSDDALKALVGSVLAELGMGAD
jgi:hypothetical protein